MIQLSYQPPLDPFHATFRVLRLREAILSVLPMEKDRLRILDFYLLFPFRIQDIRVKPTHRGFKKLGAAYVHKKPYGEQPEDKVIFDRMKPMLTAALRALAARQLIDANELELEKIVSTTEITPDEILAKIRAENESERDLMKFLSILASDYPLTGPDGLKARTQLLDHRYDPA